LQFPQNNIGDHCPPHTPQPWSVSSSPLMLHWRAKTLEFFAQRTTLAFRSDLLRTRSSMSVAPHSGPPPRRLRQERKRLAILEFTRAMDSSEAEKKDAQRSRYAPVLEFFNSLQERVGSMIRFKFTVGVRGSISNVDRPEPLSLLSALKTLGITSRINLDKICKVDA